jgi:hypothetical protein
MNNKFEREKQKWPDTPLIRRFKKHRKEYRVLYDALTCKPGELYRFKGLYEVCSYDDLKTKHILESLLHINIEPGTVVLFLKKEWSSHLLDRPRWIFLHDGRRFFIPIFDNTMTDVLEKVNVNG